MPLVRVAGALAITVSAALLVVVLVRDVGLNPLNAWTIVLGVVGGALLLLRSDSAALFAAWTIVVMAMVPALVGALGLLYIPALVLGAFGGALRGAKRVHVA